MNVDNLPVILYTLLMLEQMNLRLYTYEALKNSFITNLLVRSREKLYAG